MHDLPSFTLGITYDIQPPQVEITTKATNNRSDAIEEDLPEEIKVMNEIDSSSKSPGHKSHVKNKKKLEPITNRPSLPKAHFKPNLSIFSFVFIN